MGDGNNEGSDRTQSQFRVDLLERFEMYRTMAMVFFNRLSKEEKIEALIEVTEWLKENKNAQSDS